MLNNLRVSNFKCFKEQDISFGPLTVFSGVNGVGKSSILQALLALRQTYLHWGSLSSDFVPNGGLVELGELGDLICDDAEDSTISFSVVDGDGDGGFSCSYDVDGQGAFCGDEDLIGDASSCIFSDDFWYLAAERQGPRAFSRIPRDGDVKINWIGCLGEHAPFIFDYWANSDVENEKLILGESDDGGGGLKIQVERWLGRIGGEVRVHVTQYKNMGVVNLEFSFVRNGIPTRKYQARNVGFGLTYAFPVLLAGLAASPGGLIIVENPEAHLHPKGQAILGEFLAIVASGGVQVVVETHSDHVLNGMRIAAKRRWIDPDAIRINFLSRQSEDDALTVVTPSVDASGRIDCWPDDFFDEWDKSLAMLL